MPRQRNPQQQASLRHHLPFGWLGEQRCGAQSRAVDDDGLAQARHIVPVAERSGVKPDVRRAEVGGNPIVTPSIVQRLDFHPQVSIPFSFKGWSVTATGGFRSTYYSNSLIPATRDVSSNNFIRGLTEFELDVRNRHVVGGIGGDGSDACHGGAVGWRGHGDHGRDRLDGRRDHREVVNDVIATVVAAVGQILVRA